MLKAVLHQGIEELKYSGSLADIVTDISFVILGAYGAMPGDEGKDLFRRLIQDAVSDEKFWELLPGFGGGGISLKFNTNDPAQKKACENLQKNFFD